MTPNITAAAGTPPLPCLVVENDPALRRVLVRLLDGHGFACREAASGVEALGLLHQEALPLVLTDLRLLPAMDGEALVREILAHWPDTAIVVLAPMEDLEDRARVALQLGALDYVAYPFHLPEVPARVAQALDKRRLLLENRTYREQLEAHLHAQAGRLDEINKVGADLAARARLDKHAPEP